MIDLDDNRLEVARRFGATTAINGADGGAGRSMKLTGGRGVDTAMEAVGLPSTFELCASLVAPGGTIANIGVDGVKVASQLEQLWDRKHHDHDAALVARSAHRCSGCCALAKVAP